MYYERFDVILIILVSIVPVGFLTTYLIAVVNNHVEAGFPYISDTGAAPPESCIFAQFVNMGAFLTAVVVFTRYHHVRSIIEPDFEEQAVYYLNKIALVLGFLSAFGVSLVGNFQEINVVYVHLIGAFLGFTGIWLFCLLQTIISRKLGSVLTSHWLLLTIRIFLFLISFVAGINFVLFKILAKQKYHGKNPLKWLPTDGGYTEHLISTSSEWTLSIVLMVYLLTFLSDFRRIRMSYPKFTDRTENFSLN